MLKIAGLFEVYEAEAEHHWLLRDWDGQVRARGGYVSRMGALQDIEWLRVAALRANVVQVWEAVLLKCLTWRCASVRSGRS